MVHSQGTWQLVVVVHRQAREAGACLILISWQGDMILKATWYDMHTCKYNDTFSTDYEEHNGKIGGRRGRQPRALCPVKVNNLNEYISRQISKVKTVKDPFNNTDIRLQRYSLVFD